MALDEDGEGRLQATSTDQREIQLLRRVADGDRAAFQSLYLTYHRRLARFLMRLTRHYDVAEEIINDTLWIVWCKAGQFRAESQVSTWIMGIAYRRALKALRQRQAVDHLSDPLLDDLRDTGEEPQHTEELHEWLDQALEYLPPEQRLVLELTYYLGHSCAEIAVITDCPVNTVKTRMFHARRKLRELLPQLATPHAGGRA